MLGAGELSRRVTLLRPLEAADVAGGVSVVTWQPYARTWAKIEESSGTEATEARQLTGAREVRVWIRYRADVKSSHRVQYGNRVLELVRPPVDRDGRREVLTLTCLERDT